MFTSLTHATLSCLGQTAAVKSMPEAIVVCPCLYLLAMFVMIAYIPYHGEDSDKEGKEEEKVEEKEEVKKENPLCYEPVSSPNPAPLSMSPLQTPVASHSINLKVSVTCSYTARLNGRQPFQKTLQHFNHWYDLTYPKTIGDANHTATHMQAVKEEEQEEEEEEEEEEPEPLAAIDPAMDADNDHMDIDDDYMDVDDDAYMSLDDDPMDVVDDMDIDDSFFSAPNNQTTQEVCKPVPMDIDSSELPPRAQSPPRPSSTIQSREPENRPPPPRRGVPIAAPPRDRENPSITRPAAKPTKAITTTTTTTTAATTTTTINTTAGVPATTTTTTAAGGASQTTKGKVVADSNVPEDDPPTSSSTATATTTPHSAPSTSTQRPLSMVQRAALNKLRLNADKKIREKTKNRS